MTIPNSQGFLSATSCLPCTPEEEKEIIDGLMKEADSNMKEGDLYYLVSHSWWMNWKTYVGFEISDDITVNGTQNNPRPGEIDNSKLVSEEEMSNDLELRRNLQEGSDYTLVPREVWVKLQEWYKGGPEIQRKVISDGESRKTNVVEVYPLSLQLNDERDNSKTTIQISRKATVGELYRTVCSLLSIDQEKVELYDNYLSCRTKLENLDLTLETANLQMDQEICMAEKKPEWSAWPSSSSGMDSTGNSMAVIALEPVTSPLSIAGGPALSNGFSSGGFGSKYLQPTSFSSPSQDRDLEDVYSFGLGSSNGVVRKAADGRGLMGLHNLGNTCFMNSALQCLVHTPQLVDYFLKDYSDEINQDNPLGMQGELAVAFGELLRMLWSAGHNPVAPRNFKAKLARFAPQFSGYNQHDSQELLAFLLDGLHEDLNRVKKKPYIEIGDADGRPDELFAEECWRNHKARNDSIIVDVCQGQYKSTLVCPVCSKVSVTFDPFMYLSLPLPSTVTRSITVTVFSGSGNGLPMPFTVTVPKAGFSKDLSSALAAACCLKSSESLLLAEVYDHKIFRYIENPFETLFSIKDDDLIVAYRLPAGHEKQVKLEIMHQRADRLESEQQQYSHFSRKLIGSPLVTCIPPDQTSLDNIYASVEAVLKPFVRAKAYSTDGKKPMTPSDSGPSIDSIVLNDGEGGPSTSNSMEVDQDQAVLDIDIEEEEPSDQEEEEKGEASEELKYPFILALTDDKGVGRTPINPDDSKENLFDWGSGSVRLMMDWTEREMKSYDVSYMNDLPEVFKTGFTSKKTRQEVVTLFSCLDAFLKEEPLGPDDMWYCPKCKEHRQATKKLDLWKLPEILVVHLKRFSYSRYMKNKLDTFVNFPIRNLDLSKYVTPAAEGPAPQSYTYELYAVINHYGGLGGGHYSAYAKVQEENWYHFDDSHVSSVMSEEDIRTSAAYVLFYRRVATENPDAAYSSDSSSSPPEIPIF